MHGATLKRFITVAHHHMG